ncbi:T9SS type A sorting domain-containing protein, partial [bacterium]|nr:T9SS type A sorting domain-containing protein [bacterium]
AGPSAFGVSAVYPNPFNPAVTILFGLDRPGPVSIRVLDAYGRETAVLFEGRKSAGEFRIEWNGRDGSGMDAASGLYIIRMTAGDRTSSKKALKIQ